jgi:hypothetical protein
LSRSSQLASPIAAILPKSAMRLDDQLPHRHRVESLALGPSSHLKREYSLWLKFARAPRKTVRPFKGIFCHDISEFEFSHPARQSGLYQPTCRLDLNSWRHLVIRRPSTKNRCPSPGAAPLGFSGPSHRGPTLLDRATKRDSGAKPRDRRTGEPVKQRICHHLTVTNV